MKPTITKEQAEVIQIFMDGGKEKSDLLRIHAKDRWIEEFSCLNQLDIMTIAAALVNGYEVEKTPEEKVRELYNQHRHEAACSFTDEGTNLSLGKAFGIKEASKVFGVDVEGWDEFDNV
ncbi:hypothetical protein [Bacillus subtilis]|uniref:hypothetical protein n=1 Tax=Bacillus subtilis TaxID=1423 RepID=UPI001B905D86|nr:hypothetical protein [Bacillus subtilis]CAF1803515.1 hypothetical protein NRS6141_00818 [Bacillus subtilis]CAF1876579.1 hypothetical protein NRS6204_00294 [Bacillus subtilis]CAF1878604.1 hypothetical protein NRS6205_00294 [Bacillus subtilis]